jgi:EAL domain-containing protein (putative c-di-GMP-specific phosphodiesterase class I)
MHLIHPKELTLGQKRGQNGQMRKHRPSGRCFLSETRDRTVAQTIVVLARQLGAMATAEGIETEDQRQFLKNLGCELGPGYLFDKPLSVDQVEQQLRCATF